MFLRSTLSALFVLALALGNSTITLAVTDITTCGTVISAPGQYRLASDVGPCPANGVTIVASDVHLNLVGHTLSGTGGAQPVPGANFFTCGGGSGIAVGAVSNVHINNGTITGFFDGITLTGTTLSDVNAMTVNRNCGIGVRLNGADHNRFHANVVTENSGPPICGGYGFLGGSDGNVVTSNDISKNGDFGVLIDSSSTGNTILSSDVSDEVFFTTPTPGIEVGGSGNTIQANTASGNSLGIFVFGQNNTIQANRATGNVAFDLFDANPGCDANTWKANHFGTANQPCIE